MMKTVTLFDKDGGPIVVNACDVGQYKAKGFTEAGTEKKPKAAAKKGDVNGDRAKG